MSDNREAVEILQKQEVVDDLPGDMFTLHHCLLARVDIRLISQIMPSKSDAVCVD